MFLRTEPCPILTDISQASSNCNKKMNNSSHNNVRMMIRIDIFLWGVDGVKGWGVRCTSPIQIIIDFFGGREATTENASAVRRLPNITYRK